MRLPYGMPLVSASDVSIKPATACWSAARPARANPRCSARSRHLAVRRRHDHLPKNARVMMLPQRPYFPIAPLAAAVAYPAEPEASRPAKVPR